MSVNVVASSATSNFKIVRLSMADFIKIYVQMVGKTDLAGTTKEFFNAYDLWTKSHVYKVPSGYIRIEPYPRLKSATIHGFFTGNPFRDSENIKSVLNYYLKRHPEMSHLECHVKNEFRGVKRFVANLAHSSEYRDGKWIFYYRRDKE